MIKTIWFLIKTALIIGGALWIAERPGSVQIDWMDYTVTVHLGLFVLLFLLVVYVLFVLRAFLNGLYNSPAMIHKHWRDQQEQSGYAALIKGLNALALQNMTAAEKALEQAEKKLLMGDRSSEQKSNHAMVLVHFLQGQVAQATGDSKKAYDAFSLLSHTKNGEFLGLRSLLNHCMNAHDFDQAEKLVARVLKKYPKQKWALETAYRLYTSQENWREARKVLGRAYRAKVFDADFVRDHQAALLLAETQGKPLPDCERLIKKAFQKNPAFLPAALALANLYNDQGKSHSVRRVVQKTWIHHTHPKLATLWMASIPDRYIEKPEKRLAWIEKLVVLNPDSQDAHIAAGKVAIEQGLWGVTRQYFERALSIKTDRLVCNLMADLERRSTADRINIDRWMSKAQNAPAEKTWVCTKTGHTFDRWQAFTPPDHNFNTITWRYPTMRTVYTN